MSTAHYGAIRGHACLPCQAIALVTAGPAVVSASQRPGRRRKPPETRSGRFASSLLVSESEDGSCHAAEAASHLGCASCDSSGESEGPRGGPAARFRLRQEAPARHAPFNSSENPKKSGEFVASHNDGLGFVPILPADVSPVAASRPVFKSLGSKSDPVLHVRFPAPWSVVAKNRKIRNWRREGDSNPRYA